MTTLSQIEIVNSLTHLDHRHYFYHYTDARNIHSIFNKNALYSCQAIDPTLSLTRRVQSTQTTLDGITMYANDQLRIAESMFQEGTTPQQFRTHLDQHVFFWPTLTNLKKMLESYQKRQPGAEKIVFKINARQLLIDYFHDVFLSKYNSGSSPLYPSSCNYRKSTAMFLPINNFRNPANLAQPSSVAEVYEVLVRGRVENLDTYINTIYCGSVDSLPEDWKQYYCSIETL